MGLPTYPPRGPSIRMPTRSHHRTLPSTRAELDRASAARAEMEQRERARYAIAPDGKLEHDGMTWTISVGANTRDEWTIIAYIDSTRSGQRFAHLEAATPKSGRIAQHPDVVAALERQIRAAIEARTDDIMRAAARIHRARSRR